VKAFQQALLRVNRPMAIVEHDGALAAAHGGECHLGAQSLPTAGALPLKAIVPRMDPSELGHPTFKSAHGVEYAYVVGAMANGITSVEMVIAAATAGCIGFFGAAGLPLPQIEVAIDAIQAQIQDRPYGFNLIHNPHDPTLELETVALYLRRKVRCVSASAFMNLTLPVVYYRVKGLQRLADGTIHIPNKIMAKVSRVEVARRFLAPPPPDLVSALRDKGLISEQEAELSKAIPMAEDITAEADSGGHTDNRPAIALLPTMIALRNQMAQQYRYPMALRIGLAGGIATPQATAAAFSMGAAYVLTGSINQACEESGTSTAVREMLAEAQQADVIMAPSADMFELGVKVQVLKRGTMFPLRAAKLYELYRTYERYDDIPSAHRKTIERDYLRCSYSEAWTRTRQYFSQIDPVQIGKGEQNPKHQMALVFRSYLGQSSNWANAGEPSRKMDYQIWCGPAMGAFNAWAKGSFLESIDNRRVAVLALNLLMGAAYTLRCSCLAAQNIALPPAVENFRPLPLEEITALLTRRQRAQ
jgi:PfaD family protein